MNRYSLSSDSDRWWFPAAIAGAIGVTAVTAIFVAPAIGAQVTPIVTPADDSTVRGGSGSVVLIERPCYMVRAGWNTPAGWEQPVCTTEIGHGADGGMSARNRPALAPRGMSRVGDDYLP